MKKASTLFLKVVVILIALITVAGLLWFPQTEGRAAQLDPVQIYMDPLILYGYLASLPFFVGLYQGFKLLGYIERNKIFSKLAITAVRNIKYCALVLPVFIGGGMLFIILNAQGDDFAGPVALGTYTSFACVVAATAAAVCERLLQNAVQLKSENDLTV